MVIRATKWGASVVTNVHARNKIIKLSPTLYTGDNTATDDLCGVRINGGGGGEPWCSKKEKKIILLFKSRGRLKGMTKEKTSLMIMY